MAQRSSFFRSFATASMLSLAVGAADVQAVSNPEQDFAADPSSPSINLKNPFLYLQFTSRIRSPQTYIDYCNQDEGKKIPVECQSHSDQMEVVMMDRDTLRDMSKINIGANRAIAPKMDMDNYGKRDHWVLLDALDGKKLEGDCEEYVLYKRERLKEAGIPSNAMSIVVVRIPEGLHAVLSVRTDKGDLILDNLSNKIKTPEETGYTFVKALSLTDKQQWFELQPVSMQLSRRERPHGPTP